jgi:hypothetical protein
MASDGLFKPEGRVVASSPQSDGGIVSWLCRCPVG